MTDNMLAIEQLPQKELMVSRQRNTACEHAERVVNWTVSINDILVIMENERENCIDALTYIKGDRFQIQ